MEYVRKNCKRETLILRLKPETKIKMVHIKKANNNRSWDDILDTIIKDVQLDKPAPIIPLRKRGRPSMDGMMRLTNKILD